MKIVHVLEHRRMAGNGITDSTVELALAQLDAGHEVALISGAGEYDTQLAARGAALVRLQTARRPLATWLGDIPKVRRALRDFAPDIIHCHTPSAAIMAMSGRRAGGVVATAHTEFGPGTRAYRHVDALIAVSEANRKSLASWFPDARLRVVRNGVVGARRQLPTHDVVLPPDTILYVGGLNPRKGVDVLIEAFLLVKKEVPTAHLRVVGDGPSFKELNDTAAIANSELGVDSIVFEGFASCVAPHMRSASVVAMPSRREPFGLVAAQAREQGCAIVASDVEGLPEVLAFGSAGVLVPPDDALRLAGALIDLLKSPGLRRRYQRAAQQDLDWLSVDRVCDETMDVYEDVISRRRISRNHA